MGQTAIQDVLDQYRHTFRILYEEIARFDPQQWLTVLHPKNWTPC